MSCSGCSVCLECFPLLCQLTSQLDHLPSWEPCQTQSLRSSPSYIGFGFSGHALIYVCRSVDFCLCVYICTSLSLYLPHCFKVFCLVLMYPHFWVHGVGCSWLSASHTPCSKVSWVTASQLPQHSTMWIAFSHGTVCLGYFTRLTHTTLPIMSVDSMVISCMDIWWWFTLQQCTRDPISPHSGQHLPLNFYIW